METSNVQLKPAHAKTRHLDARRYTLATLLSMLAVSPVISSLLSWDLDGKLTVWAYEIRRYGYPTVALECLIILYALLNRLRPAMLIKPLSRMQCWMLVCVILCATFSAAQFSLYPLQVWGATAVWGTHFLFLGAIYFIGRTEREALRLFWQMLVLGTFVYIAIVLIFIFLVPAPRNFPWVSRLPGVTWVRHIGYFVAPALAVLVAFYFSASRTIGRVLVIAGITTLAIFGFWTGTRGIFFSLAISCGIASIVYPPYRKRRTWGVLLASLVVAAGISTQLWIPGGGFGMLSRTTPDSFTSVSKVGSGRVELWEDTMRVIAEEPPVGYGAGKFRTLMTNRGWDFNHPHNFVLQILFQWGPVGALGFFSLLGMGWYRSMQIARCAGISSGPAFLALNTLLAYSMIDGTGHYAFPLSMMALALGYLGSQTALKSTASLGRASADAGQVSNCDAHP